jgi:hypothetical protein
MERAMIYVASGFFEADTIPQDMVTGVVVTFIGLVMLFSIKPRLKIELRGSRENPFFLVRNRGLMQVIEIRAKLFKIDTSQTRTREILQLRVSELFQLSGIWTPDTRRDGAPEGSSNGRLLKKNEFRFRVDMVSLSKLEVRGHDYLLFQVIARHGFTNFTRLHIKRVYGSDLDSLKKSG